MEDRFNTIAGWVLGAGIAALGFTLLSGEYFRQHDVEKGGYPVEAEAGPEAAGPVEEPIGVRMAKADAAKGAEVYKKCSACHTINAGGANGTGPNLNGIMGAKHARTAGFAYSSGLVAKPGNWDFAGMDEWLRKPKAYVEGTKMGFAGLSKGQDRADVIAYLNSQGSNLPLPAVEAAAAPAAPAQGAAPAAGPAPAKAPAT